MQTITPNKSINGSDIQCLSMQARFFKRFALNFLDTLTRSVKTRTKVTIRFPVDNF